MKPNFNWDGQVFGPRVYRMPQAIGLAFINLITATGLLAPIVGALGFAGTATLALGVGYAAVIGGAILLQGILQKKPAVPQPSDVQSNIRQEISARRRIYGRSLTGSVIVFGFRRGEKSYLLHYICEGPIQGFVSFRMDKKPITLDEDGFVEQDQYFVDDRSRVQIKTTLGTMSDGPFAEIIAAFPELDTPLTPFRHRGCVMALQIVEQVGQQDLSEVYPNNMPSLQFLIDGYAECYDPRTEAAVFSVNAGVCLLTETMDVYGLTSADVGEIDFESFSEFANHCDNDVALKAGGTEKRYRCAGLISLDAENEDRIQAIASICNADVYHDSQGRIAVREKLRAVSGIALRAKNGDHLTIQLEGGRSLQKQFNTAKVTYTEPALNYKANEVRWQDPDLFEEDGTEYSAPVNATLCPSATQAQRIGKLAMAEANPDFVGSLTSGPQALDLMENYVFTLDLSPEDDFERVACASGVVEYDGGSMTVTAPFTIFKQGSSDWNPAVDEQDAVVIPPDLPSNVDDVLLDVTPTVVLQQNSAPALKFEWEGAGSATLPDSYSQQLEISATGADEWTAASVNQEEDTAFIGPVADGAAYDWRIRNVIGGKKMDWQNSAVPVTITMNPVAPAALLSFAATSPAPHLGNVVFSLTTPIDIGIRNVALYRKATGVALNVDTDIPIVVLPVASSISATYGYTDGDATRVELITDPSFDNPAAWTANAGWSVTGGKAVGVPGTNSIIDQAVALTAGVTYRYGALGSDNTAGIVQVRLAGGTAVTGTTFTNGWKFGELTALSGNNRAGINKNSLYNGKVDEFHLYVKSVSAAPAGIWDYYAVPFNGSGVDGAPSGPVTVTVI